MQQNRAAEFDEQARMECMQAGDAASPSKHIRTREGWVFLATRGYADEDDDVPCVSAEVVRNKSPCAFTCITCVPCVHGCRVPDDCAPCQKDLPRHIAECSEFRCCEVASVTPGRSLEA